VVRVTLFVTFVVRLDVYGVPHIGGGEFVVEEEANGIE